MKIETGDHYLAYVLTDDCRKKVMDLYHIHHEVVLCDHVTLCFKIQEKNIDRLQKLVDSNPVFELNCLITSETISLFRVLVNGCMIETDQSFTHLTFSRKLTAKARDSNRVLKGELKHTGVFSAGGKLDGAFQLVSY